MLRWLLDPPVVRNLPPRFLLFPVPDHLLFLLWCLDVVVQASLLSGDAKLCWNKCLQASLHVTSSATSSVLWWRGNWGPSFFPRVGYLQEELYALQNFLFIPLPRGFLTRALVAEASSSWAGWVPALPAAGRWVWAVWDIPPPGTPAAAWGSCRPPCWHGDIRHGGAGSSLPRMRIKALTPPLSAACPSSDLQRSPRWCGHSFLFLAQTRNAPVRCRRVAVG